MEDLEFTDGLKTTADQDKEWSDAAEAFLRMKERSKKPEQEKTAGMLDHIPSDMKNPFLLGAAGAGAIGNAYLSHRANQPKAEHGGKSDQEAAYEELLSAQHAKGEEGQGFLRKVHNRYNEFAGGLSKTFREHPQAATGLGAAVGAGTGFGLGKLLGAGATALKRKP